ncbi:hypothetical protein SBRCBS47491_005403 [Sporothrix bragantina]|uniref:Major facilitator superfamily (MFS) profile domain-containing protein n=1 Tax=Sporothrix bragantina TaxID=671064 RepID=A0ABP0BX83_9PEZI
MTEKLDNSLKDAEIHHQEISMNDPDPQKTGEADGADDADEHDTRYWFSWKFIGSFIGVVLLANNVFIAYSIPVSILSVINADIGPSTNISMVSLVLTLIKGVLILIYGTLSDAFGRRWFLILGQLLSGVGSVISAKAPSVDVLVGGTAIIALGGASQPLYPLFVQEIVPNKYRGIGQAVITGSVLTFIGFGPLIGRTLVNHDPSGWRWVYWMNSILCFVSSGLFFLCYFPPSFRQLHETKSKWAQIKEIDSVGFFLYASGLVVMLLGFVWSTGTAGWNTPRAYAPVAVGSAVIIAFGFWEAYSSAKTKLIPTRHFKLRSYIPSVVVGAIGQLGYFSLNLFWPQQITSLYTTDQIRVGLISSTTGTALAAGEIVMGVLLWKIKHTHIQIRVAAVLLTLFMGLMAYANEHREAFAIAMTVLAGFSVGYVELLSAITIGLIAPPDEIGIANGFLASCRSITGTIASSVFLSIYASRTAKEIPGKIKPAAEAAGLPASSLPQLMKAVANGTDAALQAVPGMTLSVQQAVAAAKKQAYSASLQTVYLSSIAFCGVALIAACVVEDVTKYMTNTVNKRIDGKRGIIDDAINRKAGDEKAENVFDD